MNDEAVPGIAADQIYVGALANGGEILQLIDDRGNLIDVVDMSAGWTAGDNSTKQTLARKDPAVSGQSPENWQNSRDPGGTPGAQNAVAALIEETMSPSLSPTNLATTVSPLSSPIPVLANSLPDIILNEILPSPIGPDATDEWIELFNQEDESANLAGWRVTDSLGQTQRYAWPEGAKIGPRQYLVLARPISQIVLNNQADTVSLLTPQDEVVDSVSYQAAPRGQSFSRFASQWSWTETLTPGQTNVLPSQPKPEAANQNPSPSPESLASVGTTNLVWPEPSPEHNLIWVAGLAILVAALGGTALFVLKIVMNQDKS